MGYDRVLTSIAYRYCGGVFATLASHCSFLSFLPIEMFGRYRITEVSRNRIARDCFQKRSNSLTNIIYKVEVETP